MLVEFRYRSELPPAEIKLHQILAGKAVGWVLLERLPQVGDSCRLVILRNRFQRPYIGGHTARSDVLDIGQEVKRRIGLRIADSERERRRSQNRRRSCGMEVQHNTVIPVLEAC